jgi:hypothetical protein
VEEIAARLAEHGRFRLLSRGDRTVAARHQTLYAVVEWSWELLTEREQELARRFALFTASASREAVEAVCDMDAAAGVLADLVDRSLVERAGDRYRMLDTVRLFCAERLAGTDEHERLAAAHARYYLGLAQRADPHLRGARQLQWLARLSADRGNLMAGRTERPRDRAWAHGGAGGVLVAERPARRGRRGGRGAPPDIALWGMVAGPPEPMGAEAGTLLGADLWNQALMRLSLAQLTVLDGRPAQAGRELEGTLACFRALGERWGTAQALDWLAMIASRRGEWARACELWAEALDLFYELGALEESTDVLGRRAEGLIFEGDLDAAAVDSGAPRSSPAGPACRTLPARSSWGWGSWPGWTATWLRPGAGSRRPCRPRRSAISAPTRHGSEH